MNLSESRKMTPEKALRWLIDFGTDWVEVRSLFNTWADMELNWKSVMDDGYLEASLDTENVRNKYKLTDNALKLIEEKQNGG